MPGVPPHVGCSSDSVSWRHQCQNRSSGTTATLASTSSSDASSVTARRVCRRTERCRHIGRGRHRPPQFYIAHVAWRHRCTQRVLFMPRVLQMFVLPLIVLVGTLLGRYRGTDWPGSPSRCRPAPLVVDDSETETAAPLPY